MPAGNRDNMSIHPVFYILVILVCVLGREISSGQESEKIESEGDTPAIRVGIEVLLNESVEMPLRQSQARALLQDVQALGALVELLDKNNNITVKIIICKAIASGSSQIQPLDGQREQLKAFIEPLFKNLVSENAELSLWAAQALSKCHDGVTNRLAEMVLNEQNPIAHRLAGISALELIFGKEALLALASLLNDPSTQIREKATDALASKLYLPKPVNPEKFKQQHLPRILLTDSETIFRWQMDRLQEQLWNFEGLLGQEQEKNQKLRQKYLEVLTAQSDSITEPQEKLSFIKKNLLDQPESFLRIWAVKRIRDWCSSSSVQTDPIAADLVELLRPYIRDDNAEVRQFTAEALGRLVEKSRDTAEELLKQLKQEENPQTQTAFLSALGTFEYLDVADEALKLLESENLEVAAQAARTLGNISAVHSRPAPAELVQKIAQALAKSYQKHLEHLEVRDDLILAMRKIAGQPAYREWAKEQFDAILKSALNDASEAIRSYAVYGLTEMHQEKVLPILREPKNFLDDPDIVVRLAVIEAYQSYPDRNYLGDLKQHLESEQNRDIAQAIRTAFIKTVEGLFMSDVYTWACELVNPVDNRELKLLAGSIVNVLAVKIGQAKTTNQPVPVEYETLTLSYQGQTARREGQIAQAMSRFQSLLELNLTEGEKEFYRREILQLALENADNRALLEQATPTVKELLAGPGAASDFETVGQYFHRYEQDPKLLLNSAQIIVYLIANVKDFPTTQFKSSWLENRREITLRLIASQEELLNGENAGEDPQAIKLLLQLDSRLSDYPVGEPVEKRRAKLAEFRRMVEGSATSKTKGDESKKEKVIPAAAPPNTAGGN